MADMSTWIVERRDARRPCVTNEGLGGKKCLFHCWSTESRVIGPSPLRGGHQCGVISETVAVLEFEDGHLEKLRTHDFKFVDGGQFQQWAWTGEKEKKDAVSD